VKNIGGGRRHDRRPAGWPRLPPTDTSSCSVRRGTHAPQPDDLSENRFYDAVKDFTPLALITEQPIVLIVRKDLPIGDLQSFIAYARANEGRMQYGSAGVGSGVHLACALLNAAIRGQCPAHSLSRRRTRHAGSHRGPDRLSMRGQRGGTAADRGPRDQGRRHSHARAVSRPALPCKRRKSRASPASMPASGMRCSCRRKTPAAIVRGAAPGDPRRDGNGVGQGAAWRRSAPTWSHRIAARPTISRRFVESEIAKWAAPHQGQRHRRGVFPDLRVSPAVFPLSGRTSDSSAAAAIRPSTP